MISFTSQSINRDRLAAALCGTPEDHPFYLGKSWVKRAQKVLAKTPVGQAAYKVAPKYGKVMTYVAPVAGAVVGTVIGSPTAGAAAGAAFGTGAAYATAHGKENKREAARKAAIFGAGVTALTALTSASGLLSAAGPAAKIVPGIQPMGTGAEDIGAQAAAENLRADADAAAAASKGGSTDAWGNILTGGGKLLKSYANKKASQDAAVTVPGIQSPFSVEGGAGGGGAAGAGGSGGSGSPKDSGAPDTQYLIMGGIALAAAYFLLKR